jgi:sugar lactone lactonase YvrE
MTKSMFPALLCVFLWACADKHQAQDGPLKQIATLHLDEVSGLQLVNGILWAHEDSGNKNELYKIDPKTGKHESVTVDGIKNTDWEDITADKEGNLYIGDTGNNDNDRRDLAIHKLNASNPAQLDYTISFYYPEQKDFPPKKKERNFDCEAFFIHNGYFYLFSKNRSAQSDGTVFIHKLENRRGYHSAAPAGSFVSCDNFRKCAIAGADISPDGKTVALISGGKLWLITNFKGDDFANGTITPYSLGDVTQKEGICFADNNTLLIADERSKKIGGNLYKLSIKDLKPE